MRRPVLCLLLAVAAGLALAGMVDPTDGIPPPGEAGAPHRPLSPAEADRFLRGRLLFDRDFLSGDGVGPVMNGDSCRACHRDPVVGGAGGIDVQVQRPAIDDGAGGFMSPPETGELAQTHSRPGVAREEIPANAVFVEERNSPIILGLGLVQGIRDETILAGEDPDDLDKDGIAGIAHILGDGSVGKLGWKANVPDLRAFVRDAMGNELGITVPATGSPFGFISDSDDAPDPELSQADVDDIVFFLELLDFAPRRASTTQSLEGEALFLTIGCAQCHVPVMDGVELYSDLLLHDVQPEGFVGVTQGMATSGLYRTAPLRGLRDTAPYFHDGRSETVDHAIRRHDGEAAAIRAAYETLTQAEREALLAFLASL
ncbi:MAG: di-heme oxidoredictase family protein [Planctomycetota bacterium]|jgi:CxxC motif-containing protein (DUF1111 family)